MEVVSKKHILGNTSLNCDVHNKAFSDLHLLSSESFLLETYYKLKNWLSWVWVAITSLPKAWPTLDKPYIKIPDMKARRSNPSGERGKRNLQDILEASIHLPLYLMTSENPQAHSLIHKSLISIPNSPLTGSILYLDCSAGYMNIQMW